MRTLAMAALLTALFGAAANAAAQEWDVNRRQYTFIDTRLTVDVQVEAEGTLRLIRGMPGRLEVAGRALNGFTGFALGDRHGSHLRLSAAGADRVEYLVVVPERVYVRIRLPDRRLAEVFGSTRDAVSYEWEAVDEPASRPAPQPDRESERVPPVGPEPGTVEPGAPERALEPGTPAAATRTPAETPTPGLFTTYRDDVAPASVSLPRADLIHTLSVRLEGKRFRVAASRPLSLERGDPTALEIRPAPPPLDIVIGVPVGTDDFVVEVGGTPAFAIVEGRPIVLCNPAMEQALDDGRLWFTFTPEDGRLECSDAALDRARKGS